jgi:hypothetical protein
LRITLQGLWDARRLPIVSGIFFASGEVRTLIERTNDDGQTELLKGEVRNIDEIHSADAVPYTAIDATCQARIEFGSRCIELHCGEGGYGGDGFVCAAENGAVLWLAFFEYSNPFLSVAGDDACVIAKNNCGEEWRFPLDSPHEVSISAHT